MLQEYMKRLILEQPADPVNFLIRSITANPYRIKSAENSYAPEISGSKSTYIPQNNGQNPTAMQDEDLDNVHEEEP